MRTWRRQSITPFLIDAAFDDYTSCRFNNIVYALYEPRNEEENRESRPFSMLSH